MSNNNIFDTKRFATLFKQNVIHHYSVILTAAVAFAGGLFIVLLIIQFFEDFQPVPQQRFFRFFMFVFPVTAILCAGTAFPSFRQRAKMHHYLLVPASAFEKFALEFLGRTLLIITLVPLAYWAVYNLEAYVISLFAPLSFRMQGFSD